MKKIKFKIIWIVVWVFLLNWSIFAINTISTWYKINHWSHSFIESKNVAFKNRHSYNNYFIPTKTTTEYNAFKSHLPSWVTKISETYTWSNSCPPRGTVWARLYQHNGAPYAVQWSVYWIYWNTWNRDINFKWPYTWYAWKILYRWSFVKRQWHCQANADFYKVIIVD